jgi:hypothetical protein
MRSRALMVFLISVPPTQPSCDLFVSNRCGRPKCREGVTEIGSVPNVELFIVQYMAVIWTA